MNIQDTTKFIQILIKVNCVKHIQCEITPKFLNEPDFLQTAKYWKTCIIQGKKKKIVKTWFVLCSKKFNLVILKYRMDIKINLNYTESQNIIFHINC